MPFIWNSNPNPPARNLPQPVPPGEVSFQVALVANTVNAGGTVLYNTANTAYDVVYELPSLNVANLSVKYLTVTRSGFMLSDPTSAFGIATKQYVDAAAANGGANISNTAPINFNVTTHIVSHANSGVTPASYGGANIVPSLVVNTTGHISSAINTSILLSGNDLISNGNGSLFIGNTLTGRCDTRTITPGTGVLVNNDKGAITLVATGDPILSGHRYGSAWRISLPQVGVSRDIIWQGVTYGGNRYVAVGLTILGSFASMISTDGILWTNLTIGSGAGGFSSVAWNGSYFVALNNTSPFVSTSPDGITWTPIPSTGYPDASGSGLDWNGNIFVAVGIGGQVMTSSNGITWTSRTGTGVAGYDWQNVTYAQGLFVAVGNFFGTAPIVMWSLDGITWMPGYPAVGTSGFSDVAHGAGLYVAVGASAANVETSVFANTWFANTGIDFITSAVIYGGGKFVAVGYSNFEQTKNVSTSSDGITWTPQPGLPPTGPTGFATLRDVTYAGLYVAVGSDGIVISSSDAITWTDRDIDPINRLVIAWNGSVFAAVGPKSVLTSPDGFAWTFNSSVIGDWRSIAWNGTVFAAIGLTGVAVQTSPDGVTWTSRTGISGTFNAVAWNGTVFAAVGLSGAVMTSPDGITWTSRTGIAGSWYGIAWNGTVFAAVGLSGAVMTSPDGITWTSRTGIAGSWAAVAWNGSVFAAVGPSIVMTSPDGIIWTSRTGISGTWNAIRWNDSVFAAVGPSIVMTSPDGIHWTQRSNIPSGTWQDIAWNGTVFAAVGSLNTSVNIIMTSQPDAVTSVAGRTGAIVLNTNDVTENAAGPFYHSPARVRGNVSNTAPINYDIGTGIFSHNTSGASATTYGNAATVPVTTVNETGHITSVVNTAIAISAAAVTSGILSVARGGTGKNATGIVNGSILAGNTVNVGYDITTIAQTAPVIVTNGRGTITLSHASSGVVASGYGDAATVPKVVVDAFGHATSVVNTAILITSNAVTATLTSDSANANSLGAFLSVNNPTGGVTAPVTTDVYTNLASMIVAAGDWDIEGSIELSVGATTAATRLTGGVSLTSNAIDISTAGGFIAYQTAGFVVSQKYIFSTGRRRISLSAATTVNLVGALTFTTLGGATWGANSFMSARRSR